MKKLTLLSIALVALSFASCKKDYTCTCTGTFNTTPSVTKIVGVSKKAAQSNCVSGTTTSSGFADVETCTLAK